MSRFHRYVGSGAFFSTVRRGKVSPSASSRPAEILGAAFETDGIDAETLARNFDIPVSEVQEHLRALQRLGLVTINARGGVSVSPTGLKALEMRYLAVS